MASTGDAGRDAGADASADAGASLGASVLMMHNHINRDGTFIDSALTEAAAATFGVDTSFAGAVSGNVYASPLYVEPGVNGAGTFYVATESGTIYALDETTGAVDWQTNVGPPATTTGTCGNISPIGITGTPAIDLGTRLIVFDAATADDAGVLLTHSIYALSIDTGALAWKVDVSTLAFGQTTFTPTLQNQRAGVLILNGVAYVAYGGNDGDCGAYHGWVVGVPLGGTGAQAWATTVDGAGIWGAGGPSSDGESIFVTTGNGKNDLATWGESEGLFRLAPGPAFSGATTDYFALYDWGMLDAEDLDLSGAGPMVIDAPSMTPSALVLAQGKDGNLYLVSRDDLGGIATMTQPANVGSLTLFTNGGKMSNAGAWATANGTTYVVVRPNGIKTSTACPTGTKGDIVTVKLDPTAANKMSVVWCADSGGVGSPSITTTDGNANAMVWVFSANPSGASTGGRGQLYAYDLLTGTQVFAGGGASSTFHNVRSLTTPIAVHGRIFVGGDGQLYAFKAQ